MDYKSDSLRQMAKQGKAMKAPGQDRPARFPIANRADLLNAIKAVGRVQPPTDEARAKVRRHILQRARELDLLDLIPPTWATDGSLKS